MALASAPPRIDRPPHELDALIDWFEWVSERLVLLELFDLDDVGRAVGAIDRAVRDHLAAVEDGAFAGPGGDAAHRLALDHRMYPTSLEQLAWFLRVVVRDDHGGNRQALGQYGRLLAESLGRHREEERRLAATPRVASATPPSKGN